VTTNLSCSRPILIKSYSTIGSRKVKVKIRQLEAGTTLSLCLERVQIYALKIKIVVRRVFVNSKTISTHTRCLQVAIAMKKPINILQGLRNSK
jgi:hypothetical protein